MRQTSDGFFSAYRRYAKVFILAVAAFTASAEMARAQAKDARYAAIVIDANTGKTLHSANADAPRYPASLTKMMTLYMVFDAIDAGRITLDSKVPFSSYAASRPPTKLGIRAGGTITVEQAILSLVTKSANDAATALGELVGGTEANFARMMTAKARQLGMSRTTFRNASGLPDANQKTTARDMATLGIALREHHSKHYGYFSTRSFQFGKTSIGNHNRLLGRVKGVDGIKTGYINASGYNLVTSVADGNKRMVAVVLGGRSGASRDNQMVSLVTKFLPAASNRKSGQLIARGSQETPVVAAAYASPLPRADAPVPFDRPGASIFDASTADNGPQIDILPEPTKRPSVNVASLTAAPALVDPVETASTNPAAEAPVRASIWAVQVASLDSEREANGVISKISNQSGGLLQADAGFTEAFSKDGKQYYRARFGGYSSKDKAWATCDALKKKNISCYAVQR